MSEVPKCITWRGKDVETLTHDELREAFQEIAEMYWKMEQRWIDARRSAVDMMRLAAARR